jgi:hypothetical protein
LEGNVVDDEGGGAKNQATALTDVNEIQRLVCGIVTIKYRG